MEQDGRALREIWEAEADHDVAAHEFEDVPRGQPAAVRLVVHLARLERRRLAVVEQPPVELASEHDEIERLPRVPVHLDYHSRNLMLPPSGLPLGIIDFQDAVEGPVTYDLASLLYDCYQDYAEDERQYWSLRFYESLPEAVRHAFGSGERWHRAVRLTAFQRHIKAIGIFARLAYRDGKLIATSNWHGRAHRRGCRSRARLRSRSSCRRAWRAVCAVMRPSAA